MGKIDYDVGDLVVAVRGSIYSPNIIRKGDCFECLGFVEGYLAHNDQQTLGVVLPVVGVHGTNFWEATMFRKLPKKSQEFFTGEFHVEPV